MMKSPSKRIKERKDGKTISNQDANSTPNQNLRINKHYILSEPEIRALNAIYKPDSDTDAIAYGEPIDKKIFNKLWIKGLVRTETSCLAPLLTDYGVERLKWSRNELDAEPDDVRFAKDPKVRNDK